MNPSIFHWKLKQVVYGELLDLLDDITYKGYNWKYFITKMQNYVYDFREYKSGACNNKYYVEGGLQVQKGWELLILHVLIPIIRFISKNSHSVEISLFIT